MKKITIARMAEKLGCTHSTVSRALNNRPGVSAELKKKILQMASREHYVSRPSSRLAAIIYTLEPDLPDYYSALLIHRLSLELQRLQLKSIIIQSENVDFLTEHFVCGAISLSVFGKIARVWPKRHSQPLLCINDYSNIPDNVYSINSDERSATYEVTARLLAGGHRKAALFCVADDTMSRISRQQFFLDAGEELGLHYDLISVHMPIGEQDKLRLIRSIPEDDSAVVFAFELLTLQLINELKRERGNLFTAGWTFEDGAKFMTRPDLAVMQDLGLMSKRAATALKNSLSGEKIPFKDQLIPCKIEE